MKRKCNSEYNEKRVRNNKEKTIIHMFKAWKAKNPEKYIHVGVFNPSTTCLDLDIAVNMNLIREDTKLIFFENFQHVPSEDDRKESVFKQKVMSHIPMVKKENVLFHFGDLEKLQLGNMLLHTGSIEKIDFMFLDFCGELTPSHAQWLYDNRYFIAENSFQFYTVCIQAKMRYDKKKKMEQAKEFVNKIQYIFRSYKEEDAINRDKLDEAVKYWHFNCSTILNTEYNKKYVSLIPPLIYSDGTYIMGIFNSQYKSTKDYLWNFYQGFRCGPLEKDKKQSEEDFNWDSMKKNKENKFTNYENNLFRDMPIPKIDIDEQSIQIIIDEVKRTQDKPEQQGFAALRGKICTVFDRSFFPEIVYEFPKRYTHSRPFNLRCVKIFNKYFLNKIFFDKREWKYGKFIAVNNSRSLAKYRFEYVDDDEISANKILNAKLKKEQLMKKEEQYQHFLQIEKEVDNDISNSRFLMGEGSEQQSLFCF